MLLAEHYTKVNLMSKEVKLHIFIFNCKIRVVSVELKPFGVSFIPSVLEVLRGKVSGARTIKERHKRAVYLLLDIVYYAEQYAYTGSDHTNNTNSMGVTLYVQEQFSKLVEAVISDFSAKYPKLVINKQATTLLLLDSGVVIHCAHGALIYELVDYLLREEQFRRHNNPHAKIPPHYRSN